MFSEVSVKDSKESNHVFVCYGIEFSSPSTIFLLDLEVPYFGFSFYFLFVIWSLYLYMRMNALKASMTVLSLLTYIT